jgi:hypothetical protein
MVACPVTAGFTLVLVEPLPNDTPPSTQPRGGKHRPLISQLVSVSAGQRRRRRKVGQRSVRSAARSIISVIIAVPSVQRR